MDTIVYKLKQLVVAFGGAETASAVPGDTVVEVLDELIDAVNAANQE
jgi:hypothetical protein